jgi:hypothetical protein
MYYMGGELKSLAAMSLWRSVDFPQEFRECPDDMGRSSQFWAREIVRRQESAPRAPVGDDYSGAGDVTEACTEYGPVRKARLT